MDFALVLAGLIVCLAPGGAQINTQNDLNALASGLGVVWDVVTNTREIERYEVEITLTNGAATGRNLANDGWQLHVSCVYMVEPDLMGPFGHTTIELPGQQVTVTHLGGSHFYFSPTAQFTPIPPGRSRKIKFKVRYWSVARTDSMPNWYLTFPNLQPSVVTETSVESLHFVADRTRVEQVKRYDFDRYMPFTPQDRFLKYRLNVDQPSDADIRLVPKPVRATKTGDTTITIDQTWVISCPSNLANEATYLRDSLSTTLNIQYDTQAGTPTGPKYIRLETGQVAFTEDEARDVLTESGEAYSLTVDTNAQRVTIIGRDTSGVFYGAVSLASLTGDTNQFPAYSIVDAPRFEYRGFMLDIARNFHSDQEISTLIEAMALYKLNKLHLHLSDDEAWRLQIASLPELTQLGSTQCYDLQETRCLMTELGAPPGATSKFLTAAQYKFLLDLANKRHLTIIPEVDMPGHARAAIKSMDLRMSRTPGVQDVRLTEADDPSKYISNQMFSDNALNPCLTSAWTFIEIIMDELIKLHRDAGHPLETFHFGGDEVAKGAFVNSTACQNLRASGQLPEDSVKAYLMQELGKRAHQKGLTLSAWEDGLMEEAHNRPFNLSESPAESVTAYAWSDVWDWGMTSRTYALANAGYKVVMTHATHLYFDHPAEPDPEERGYYWATRYTDAKKCFSYNAANVYQNIKVRLSGEPILREERCPNKEKCPDLNAPLNIIGMQSTLFSETSRTESQVHHQVFPRILAFAERAWHKAEWEEMAEGPAQFRNLQSDWAAFAHTVSAREFDRLKSLNVHYRIPTPGARLQNGILEVTSEFPGFDVLYSVNDGKDWTNVTPGLQIPSSVMNVMLRTSSKDGTRFSRTVTLKTMASDELSHVNQATLDYIGDNLEVELSVVDNYEEFGDDFFLGRLKLKNTGNIDIPGGNWKIYLGTLKMFEPEALLQGEVMIKSEVSMSLEHIQGPLISLGPTINFQGLSAGAEIVMSFKGQGSSVSADDFLPNWYVSAPGLTPRDLVSTATVAEFVAPFTTEKAYKRTSDDQYSPWSPEKRYERNAERDVLNYEETRFQIYSHAADGPLVQKDLVVPTVFNFEGMAHTLNLLWGEWDVEGPEAIYSLFKEWMTRLVPEVRLVRNRPEPKDRVIRFEQGDIPGTSSLEAYSIRFNAAFSKYITVKYEGEAGAFRAIVTIIQLLMKSIPRKPYGSIFQSDIIVDTPRFDYRGFYLDTARFFMPKEDVLRVLDVMALYKLNILHLHLSDDEGWRLEIPGLPELTQVGSNRCHDLNERDCLLDTLGSGDSEGEAAQFYTASEFQEILRYAQARHIQVIPEFDMPGHSRASIRSMLTRWKNLNDLGKPTEAGQNLLHELTDTTKFTTPQYYTGNVVNPCLQSSYTFVQSLYNAVNTMYKNVGLPGLKVLHLGGDDVPDNAWLNSSICADWLRDHKFIIQLIRQFPDVTLNVWEDAMFPDRTSRSFISKQQLPNGIMESVICDAYNTVPDSGLIWRAYTLGNENYKVVMAPASHYFFDHPEEPDPVEGGNIWASRYTDTYKTFTFMPFDLYGTIETKLSGEAISRESVCQENGDCPRWDNSDSIIGLKGVMPALRVKSVEEFDFHVFPRLLAVAERAWHMASWEENRHVFADSAPNDREMAADWAKFAIKLGGNDLAILDKLGVKYRIPPPGVKLDNMTLKANVEFPGLKVQYQVVGGVNYWFDLERHEEVDYDKEILLRTASPDGTRFSRVVKIKTKTKSENKGDPDGASGLAGSLSMTLVLVGLLVAMATCARGQVLSL